MNALELEQASDDLLLKRYVEQNDREALGVLFRRHADAVYATAMRLCRNSADAEDVVQTVFIKIMESASQYRGGSEMAVKAWLMKSVVWTSKQKIRGEVRRRNREEIANEEQEDSYCPDEQAGQEADLKERAAEILEVLDDLPEHYREALWMHYCQGLSVKDAASALEMPEKTFRNTVGYGLRKLKQKLEEKGVSATVASVVAALPCLPSEAAPVSLLNQIGGLISGASAGQASSAASVSGAKAIWHLLKLAAGALFVAGACVAVLWPVYKKDFDATPATRATAVTQMQIRECAGDVVVVRAGKAIKAVPCMRVDERDQIVTGSKSYCLVECPDRTQVAMNEQSRLTVAKVIGSTPGELTLDGGVVYVDLPKRDAPFAIISSGARCDATGTKFVVESGRAERLWVVEGEVKYSAGSSIAYVDAGKTAESAAFGEHDTMIVVATATSLPEEKFAWVKTVGVDNKDISRAFADVRRATDEASIDFNNYRIVGGTWKILGAGNDRVIRQEDPDRELYNAIFFGKPRWTAGVITFKFRFMASTGENPSVSVALSNTLNAEMCGMRSALTELREIARDNGAEGWIVMKLKFEVDKTEQMTAVLNAWPEKKPSESREKEILFPRNPLNSFVGKRDVCGAGLATLRCSVEFKDLKISEALAPAQTADKPVYHHWDFNTPGVPPELKCTVGNLKHAPGGGPDGKGCLEVSGPASRIRVDVEISRFPVIVKWRGSWISVAPGREAASKSFWFPSRDVATLQGMDNMKVAEGNQRIDRWRETVNYHSGTYIDRWSDGSRLDMTIGRPEPSGRIVLFFRSDYQIDDLTIMSISTNDLPDTGNLLKLAERIPADKSKGSVIIPELKSRDGRSSPGLYFIKGYVDEETAFGPPER